ncbi:MAG: amidohydrolase family protein [Phycisphaerae bacterium]|nr:amidohydrolase family protein [Phycisphaerae bacterium]
MNTLRQLANRLRDWLQSRYVPWQMAALAILLCVPSLWLGRLLDDDIHRLALTRPDLPTLSRSPAELFVFIEGDAATNRLARAMGMLPWWAEEELRLAFYRPLTGLTHWLDYQLWPELPSLMHLHSLVWLGAVVTAAAFLYRRLLGVTWVAGLAALFFAVDDAHGLPAVWIANRNALIGVFFGLLTLIAHDRWRRDGWWMGAVLAPLAFLLGLLAKESTLSIGAYLFAYALFLDRSAWTRRFTSLVPCALVGAGWWVTYKQLGYGAAGSLWYVDPGANPVRFAQAVADRAPNLLAWQWLVPSDPKWTLSPEAAHTLWLAAMGVLVIIAAALVPLLRRDRLARFWALGMLLSVLPACTAYPSDRLLFFVGIGGMGLLAQLVAAALQNVDFAPMLAWRRMPARALCVALVFIHLVMAPWHLARASGSFKGFGRSIARVAASLPSDPAARFQTVLIVSSPTWASFAYGALTRWVHDEPYLNPTLVLGSGSHPIEIERTDQRTLLVRPHGGFFAPLGNPSGDCEMAQLLFHQQRAILTLDGLYRDNAPIEIGREVQSVGVSIEVTAITDDGRPAEAAFHFLMELETPFFRWLQWGDGEYVPFNVPAVGQTVTLPAATVLPWPRVAECGWHYENGCVQVKPPVTHRTADVKEDLLITNARLIDGTGAPHRTPCAIRIHAGRIAEIKRELPAGDESLLDVGGATVLPGLIDPHVHLQAVPGSTFRMDDEDRIWQARLHHLRAYLACGVTTVLDASISAPVLRQIRSHLDSGGVGPRFLALAPTFYPPDGYLDHNYLTDAWGPMWRPAGTAQDVSAIFDEYEGISDIIGVKVMIEYGFSLFYDWPILAPDIRGLIMREAAARSLPIFAHSIQQRAHAIALEMQPRALMHSGLLDGDPPVELMERMKAGGTYMVTTLSGLFDCLLERRSFVRGIDDSLILSTVPKEQVDTVRDPRAWRYTYRHMLHATAPRWLPASLATVASWFVAPAFLEIPLRRAFRATCQAVLRLHEAGVRIVRGTDSGAWPVFPSCFHGYSTIREMEIMAAAGLRPMAVLQAATRLPAEMMGLEEQIGTVEVGKCADLIVLTDDPLADMKALRSV